MRFTERDPSFGTTEISSAVLLIEIGAGIFKSPRTVFHLNREHAPRRNKSDNHPGKPIQIGKRRIIIHEKRLVCIPQQVCNAEPQGSANHESLTATASSIFLGRLPPSMYSRILRSLSTRRTSAALRTCSFSAMADARRSILQVSLSWSKSSPMVCWELGQIMLRAREIVRKGEDMEIYSKDSRPKKHDFCISSQNT